MKALRIWLAEARFVLLCALVTAIALSVSLRPGTAEHVIRLTGLVLQLFGIATVVWGIAKTRELFGHPTLFQTITSWFKRSPLMRRNAIVAAVCASLSSTTARGYGTHGPGENPTIENRVDALEKNIGSLHNRITQAQNELDQQLSALGTSLQTERQIRQGEDSSILDKLEATSTGGVHISAIGAIWLFVGVTLSTVAIEIESLLK